MLMHHFGSGICSQIRCRTGIIFIATRPATIIRSHCRGLNRITSAPNRAMSNRLAPTAISSMPQQAVANGIGQRLYLRHQLTTASSVVRIVFSGTSTRPARAGPSGSSPPASTPGVGMPVSRVVPTAIRTPPSARRRRTPPPGSTMKTRISQKTRSRKSAGMPATTAGPRRGRRGRRGRRPTLHCATAQG